MIYQEQNFGACNLSTNMCDWKCQSFLALKHAYIIARSNVWLCDLVICNDYHDKRKSFKTSADAGDSWSHCTTLMCELTLDLQD